MSDKIKIITEEIDIITIQEIKGMTIISRLSVGTEEGAVYYDFQKTRLPGTCGKYTGYQLNLKNGFKAFVQLSISLNSTN